MRAELMGGNFRLIGHGTVWQNVWNNPIFPDVDPRKSNKISKYVVLEI
jgi:hypothetical protein